MVFRAKRRFQPNGFSRKEALCYQNHMVQRLYMYPDRMPPASINATYNAMALFFKNVESPAITHALVAEPVIIKAIIAPSLEPDAIIVCMIGAADSVVT